MSEPERCIEIGENAAWTVEEIVAAAIQQSVFLKREGNTIWFSGTIYLPTPSEKSSAPL